MKDDENSDSSNGDLILSFSVIATFCWVPIKCETKQKRNETKRNEINENETKRNEINKNETKRNEINETKRNQRNENEMKRNQRKQNEIN